MAPLAESAMRFLSIPSALHLSITLAGDWCGRRPHSWRSTLLALGEE
jgi:hypothetical protein